MIFGHHRYETMLTDDRFEESLLSRIPIVPARSPYDGRTTFPSRVDAQVLASMGLSNGVRERLSRNYRLSCETESQAS
jgi:hypothetical protein